VADLTSEIVGNDEDPLEAAQDLQPLVEGGWSAAGDLEIFELNRQLLLQLPEAEGHHTLAGFLLERFQHIPTPGETLRWKGSRYTVLSMDGPRIERVKILTANGEGADHR
jgi:CBS domain containing-hemolysin-like protein